MTLADVASADKVLRDSFLNYLGMEMWGDTDVIGTRCHYATGKYVAEIANEIVGLHFTINRGSFQYRGPMAVNPTYGSQKIGQKLMDRIFSDMCNNKEVTSYGLFTFPTSTKHLYLYRKQGFNPTYLTQMLSKTLDNDTNKDNTNTNVFNYNNNFSNAIITSQDGDMEKQGIIKECRMLSNMVHKGLDLTIEIKGLLDLDLGFIAMIMDENDRVCGFGIIHCGKGTEAGSQNAYIKFGIAKDKTSFGFLLNTIEMHCRDMGNIKTIRGGMNTARVNAFNVMHGDCRFEYTPLIGVAMERNSEEYLNSGYQGYNKENIYIIDDWM